MKYFHISYIGGVPLLFPIINRLNAAKQTGAGNEFGIWGPKMGDAAIALVTKIRSVQIAVERLNGDISALNNELAEVPDSVEKCLAHSPPKALVLRDEAVGFQLVASLDAFLYEARSAYEMLRTFVIRFARHILMERCSERDGARILEQAMLEGGHSSGWVEDLRLNRATFFHETAPWFAMEMTSREPRRYELLILNDNVADLEKSPNYAKLEEYRLIWLGLQTCATDMQRWALKRLDQIGTPELP